MAISQSILKTDPGVDPTNVSATQAILLKGSNTFALKEHKTLAVALSTDKTA